MNEADSAIADGGLTAAAPARADFPFAAVVATLVLSVTGTMLFKVLPLVVGAAAESFGLAPQQLGLLASADLAGITLVSLLMPFWVRRVDWRRAALAALAVVVAGNLLSTAVDQFHPLLMVRFVTGLGEGAATGLALVILSDSRDADRYFALAVGAPVLIGLAGFQLLPPIIREWGFDGLVTAFAAIAVLIALATRWLPAHGRPVALAAGGRTTANAPVFLALTATAVFHIALGAVWAFIERIGDQAGLAPELIGRSLGIAVVCGFLGAMTTTAIGTRWGRRWPLIIGVAVQATSLLLMRDNVDATGFLIAACLFQYCWLFVVPYQLGIIALNDLSGRFFALTIAFQAAGVTLGPLLAGQVAGDDSYVPVRWLAAACMVLALAVLLPLASPRPARGSDPSGV